MKKLFYLSPPEKRRAAKTLVEVVGWLVAILLFIYASHAALAQSNAEPTPTAASSGQPSDAETLTPDEEGEARELASQFVKRFRETNDIAPLVDEMYIADFARRMQADQTMLPMLLVERGVALRSTPEELRQFYISEFNLFTLFLEYVCASNVDAQESDGDAEDDDDVARLKTAEEIFPPDVLALLKNERFFADIFAKEKAERDAIDEGPRELSAQEDDDNGSFFKTTEQIRGSIKTREQTVAALRAYRPALAGRRRARKARKLNEDKANRSDEDFDGVGRPRLETFEEEFYGFPPATRFVCINVEPDEGMEVTLYLVKVNTGLKVLTAFHVIDD